MPLMAKQSPTTNSRSHLWLYVPLWFAFVYLFVAILGFDANSNTNIVLGGMYFIEFGVHEASHIVTAFLPSIFTAAAGSIGEVSFTILLAVAVFRAKSYFAGAFSLLWVMLAMNSAGAYMADARTQQMQLVGLGPDPQHDWHYVFSQLGWLDWDTVIGNTVRVMGDVTGLVGIAIGLAVIVSLFYSKSK